MERTALAAAVSRTETAGFVFRVFGLKEVGLFVFMYYTTHAGRSRASSRMPGVFRETRERDDVEESCR